jgi:hypothetical protein
MWPAENATVYPSVPHRRDPEPRVGSVRREDQPGQDKGKEAMHMRPLHDWIEEQRRLLTEFQEWWKENHKVSSVQFPLSLDEADWVAQFAFFCKQQKQGSQASRRPES